MSAVDAGNLGRDIVQHGLAGRRGGLRPVPGRPANEGVAVVPSRAGHRRDAESHDYLDRSKSVHWLLLIRLFHWLRSQGQKSALSSRWEWTWETAVADLPKLAPVCANRRASSGHDV